MVSFSSIAFWVLLLTESGFSNPLQNIKPNCNACTRSPCGHNTVCSTTIDGYAECHCAVGYEPDLDPIYGCNKLCATDDECPLNNRCNGGTCRPSSCFDRCGTNALCGEALDSGSTTCTCPNGYIGNPYVQCDKKDFNFTETFQKPNRSLSCDNSLCGPNTMSNINQFGISECECITGSVLLVDEPHPIWDCTRPCTSDSGCTRGQQYCERNVCEPCSKKCGSNANCNSGHSQSQPCYCLPGYEGDPCRPTSTERIQPSNLPPTTTPTNNPQEDSLEQIFGPTLSFVCGTRRLEYTIGRIRGTNSILSWKYAWPWMAQLGTTKYIKENGEERKTTTWFCGGVLINELWVLSAAHCVDERDSIDVRLGHNNPDKTDDVDTFEAIINERIVLKKPHEKYDSNQPTYYDFSLLKLNRRVNISDKIRPICLPWHDEPLSSRFQLEPREAHISGWGVTKYGIIPTGEETWYLRDTTVKIVNTEECNTNYTNYDDRFPIKFPHGITDDLHICANDPITGADTCQGDSGGPLSLKDDKVQKSNTTERFVLIGITSGGTGCGDPHLPGLYGPVGNPEILKWIKEVAFSNFCSAHEDCSAKQACDIDKCFDLCGAHACGRGAICTISNKRTYCDCPTGTTGDPRVICWKF